MSKKQLITIIIGMFLVGTSFFGVGAMVIGGISFTATIYMGIGVVVISAAIATAIATVLNMR